MPGGRICRLCASGPTIARAADLISKGLPDATIAAEFGLSGDAGRMCANRHRRFHVEAPARAIVAAASKGRHLVEERQQAVAAAENGDDLTAAWLTIGAVVADLKAVHDRLSRSAESAEQDNSRMALAALSGQALRAMEVRGRLANLPGFVPQRSVVGDGLPVFNLTISFSGHTETLTATAYEPNSPHSTHVMIGSTLDQDDEPSAEGA